MLQQRARSLENEIRHRQELEGALRNALREQTKAEDELRACVEREKTARLRAEASENFKQLFLGVLGHELRNPLNTVLTTARLMTMRGELAGESVKRLERIVTSGERMKRMIEQLLDVTRARHTEGIPVKLGDLLMPVMSGGELIEAMQQHPDLKSLPILISTSAPDRAPSGYPVMAKPIDILKVWDRMRESCHCAEAAPR